MPKYTEAFFNITHKPVTIMQIRNEYNLDHTVYERRYKGHIFCPYCKAVPLTVVHTNGLLYYRGHPHEEHGEGCMYTLKEIVIKDVEKIGGDIEKQAVSQLDMLLRSMGWCLTIFAFPSFRSRRTLPRRKVGIKRSPLLLRTQTQVFMQDTPFVK